MYYISGTYQLELLKFFAFKFNTLPQMVSLLDTLCSTAKEKGIENLNEADFSGYDVLMNQLIASISPYKIIRA